MVNRLFNRLAVSFGDSHHRRSIAHQEWMWQSWRIDQLPEHRFTVVDDRPEGGKKRRPAWSKKSNEKKIYTATSIRSYQWPLRISDPAPIMKEQGLIQDNSNFSTSS